VAYDIPSDAAGVGLALTRFPLLAVHRVAFHSAMRACMGSLYMFCMRRIVLAAALSGVSWVAAATNATDQDSDDLKEIVVVATRTATSALSLAVPVIIINRADIERSSALDAADLLSARAGLEVARNGGAGQPASVFIRGSESNHSTVLIDGVRMNPGTIGGAALQNILPESIERMEIVKGARSSIYGSEAIGGVISIATRAATANGVSAAAAAGRYGLRQVSLNAGTAFGNEAHIGGSFAFQNSDGYSPLTSSTTKRGFRNASANLQANTKAGEYWRLGAQLWNSAGRSEYLGYDNNFRFGALDQSFINRVVAAKADYANGKLSWKTTLSRTVDDIQQRQFSDNAKTNRDVIDTLVTLTVSPQQEISAGVLLSRETVDALSFGTRIAERTNSRTVFLQDQIHLGQLDGFLALGTS
jgi:vitamin B12 transporter